MELEEERTRRIAALASIEKSADALGKFIHNPSETDVITEQGNLPPLSRLVNTMTSHEADMNDFLGQVTNRLNALVPDIEVTP